MPNAAPSARYDLPWKAALAHAFRAFIEFFFPQLCGQIDWSKRPRSRDKELVRLGFNDVPNGLVADKLVEVSLRDGRQQWVLVHVEVQAQRDASLARRVLDYNYRIFKEYGEPVASLVLLADDDPAWHPHAFYSEVLGTIMGISFATAKLLDYGAHNEKLLGSANPFALITLAHLRKQQARHDPDQLYAAKWQVTKLLYRHGWSKRRIIVLFDVINWMMALPAPHQKRYWQAIRQLEKERSMKWVEPLEQFYRDQGWEKGLKKGRQEGRQEGAAALLERQLIRRFGPLPQTVRNKLAKSSLAQIDAWSDALPDAESLKQVFATK